MAKPTTKKRPGWGVQSVGQKRPFTQQQIQLIRYALDQLESDRRRYMERALLETALSTCLRSVDLLALNAGDISQGSFPFKQRKTARVLLVRLNSKAQKALADWIAHANLGPADKLWRIDRQSYGDIVKGWARLVHLDPRYYSTHSMRRTMPAHLYKQTGNVKAASELLGHADLSNTGAYLGIDTQAAHVLAEEHDI